MNVWIVEDDPGYRRNLRMSLELEDGISVGQVFPSCEDLFVALETSEVPDVVLMDLGLPGMGGIEAIRKLSVQTPELAVMVLTVFSEKKKVAKALKAGAAGYLLKESDATEIARSLGDSLSRYATGIAKV
ncbi:response regulator [Pontiella desulfatans]|nr:response regulator transcription factor [Pontiella desulfatans]